MSPSQGYLLWNSTHHHSHLHLLIAYPVLLFFIIFLMIDLLYVCLFSCSTQAHCRFHEILDLIFSLLLCSQSLELNKCLIEICYWIFNDYFHGRDSNTTSPFLHYFLKHYYLKQMFKIYCYSNLEYNSFL